MLEDSVATLDLGPSRNPIPGSGDPSDAGERPPPLAHVSAFVCRELERIGREVGFPLAVRAATSDPGRHAARLSKAQHVGWSARD